MHKSAAEAAVLLLRTGLTPHLPPCPLSPSPPVLLYPPSPPAKCPHATTRCPQDFNVLRYSPGQHYNSHMDTFDPHYLAQSNPEFGQRMATFLMYLSDVEEGGETVFKHEGKYGEWWRKV